MNTLRFFFRLEKLGRIPHIGNVGLTYVTPMVERQQALLKDALNESFSGNGDNGRTRSAGNLITGRYHPGEQK
jgi:hypothetical protein